MSDLTVFRTVAPAKINWTLEVVGRRDDGYHEIRSVMQTLSLGDTLTAQRSPSPSFHLFGPLSEVLASAGPVQNLVMQAARVFPNQPVEDPVALTLDKHIPLAAGLGGGSSDAAAALRLLARLWNLKNRAALRRVAAQLGSDVPFFLRGGAQIAAGRGDVLTPLPASRPVYVVLLTPPEMVPNKTARLYAELRTGNYTDGAATQRLAAGLNRGERPTADDYVNVFDRVADGVFPWLNEYRRVLERATGARALLAGAGPSLFALVGTERRSRSIANALRTQGLSAAAAFTTGRRAATHIEAL